MLYNQGGLCADDEAVKGSLHYTLSLRNLVPGYDCGRVFPAGVGPGSPSRDALQPTGCLCDSACHLDAAAVWLAEDAVPRCAPLPCPNLVPFGRVAAREGQGAPSRRAW